MDDLVADPVSTARLVEFACISLDRVIGGLPGSALYDGGAVYRECALMTLAERREAAYTAVDSLVAAFNVA